MLDWRAALQRSGRAITREVHKVRRNFQRALQEERRQRVQAVGSNIEGLLEADRVKVAWDHLTRWYCQDRGKKSHPTREVMDQDLAVRADLYRFQPT